MPPKTKTLERKIYETKVKISQLKWDYGVQLYLETMPEHDPLYTYCYDKSNFTIPYQFQSVYCWLQAVAIHMSSRRPGHGGAANTARIIPIPVGFTDERIDYWLTHTTEGLRKLALARKTRKATK